MRKAFLSVAAAAFLVASALAAEADEAIGAIVSVDAAAGTVTLDSGQTFLLSTDIDPSALELGQHVTITYQPTLNGVNAATKVTPLSKI